ncbi:hypothetical protein COV16_05065 [Candidatus Woesearchaeota archaeon CG10_big_fil_rev_8_21_14_0_10_34_8]|nr:MAG: hypothetical protein COV16_05065 [Candidatus Woesearchaeota archaeon CG10_big_fil_rev_8_21_14_0_10_34_8]
MKKAQTASSAATLIILIAGMILLYLLFLPSAEREALLQDDYSYPDGGSSSSSTTITTETATAAIEELVGETILSESPGQIYYLGETSYEHELSAVNLYTTTEADVLYDLSSLYVKNGMFDQLFKEVTFYVDDPDYTDNVLLSFNIEKAQGRLMIYLNGELILDGDLGEGTLDPIELDSSLLSDVNVMEFSVSEVGYKFWTTNEYQLENIQITGDVTDISQQVSKTTFTVSDTEKYNLQRARLYYYPDCSPKSVGALRITVNNDIIYSSIPDCQQINMVEFSPSVLSAGDNYLTFKTEKGEYLIYSINVKTELEEQEFPTYYFELDEDAFIYSEEVDRSKFTKDYNCGDTDGYCPSGCSEDDDPDCCFEGRNQYWCDVQPDDAEMRCTEISEADTSKCGYCPSGYEDEDGYAPDECEEECGDDRDGACPSGCSKYYDQDCCYEEDEDNFWCNEVPIYGLSNACETSLSEDECDHCPSGYEGEGSNDPDCPDESSSLVEVYDFFPGYDVYLVFTFVDDTERKNADVYVNGHKFYLDTYDLEYVRQVTDYIEPGTNSIKIEPRRSLEIRKLEVVVEQGD